MKKGVLFDLDGTILDFEKSEDQALKRTFLKYGIPLTEEQVFLYREINRKWWRLLAEGKVSKDVVVIARFEEFLKTLDLPLDLGEVAKDYLEFLSEEAYFLLGAEEFLEKLKKKDLRMAVVTNGVKFVQEKRSRKLRLDRFFDFVLTSEEAGVEKPDPRIFWMALERMKLKKEEVLYVGDDLNSDLEGARSTGIDFVLFSPEGDSSGDFPVARNFEELGKIVEEFL
ncbi:MULTISPECIES: YjjG family noncanonical pyrimidine nucleotidase [unclassified Thermotoga]|uniref:YjjG family noncanonical pyrimidine nucleotidase n=1 Tax=unclassified Thermotoga TaxID=2631113 RepID=UPI0005422E0F|nr:MULTISPECIES: YjjG family noncanonical pyrimidine nucleotidase [unclassified Thermotoga]KAF2960177.1 haloacid dehalogenase [Thermotoga sp. 38H-to]KHC91529.1 HAD superfamily (subfamily IA) hydrolase, TIGR02254 [Thermotoga sp. Mc24]